MKKTIRILFFMLCCGVLAYGGVKASAKSFYALEDVLLGENDLKQLRAKVKILFPDIIEYDKISPKYFEKDKDKDENVFIMRFSNIIYKSRGKIVKVPIFRGTMGDVLYDDFLEYCNTKGILKDGSYRSWPERGRGKYIENGFEVKFNKGEFTKALDEFRKFYGRHLSINFNTPADVSYYSEEEQINTYSFVLDGVKGELSFYYPHEKYRNEAVKLEYCLILW